DIKRVRKTAFLPLKALRAYPELAALRILQRGNRLSITPVDPRDWIFIVQRLGG
ncbi:MAG TPA: EVE domain-containing protein, partial [Betaproteobacteria bacterium]|nr:EVE domain-containing protein [Betaproteobacteria bacterium]